MADLVTTIGFDVGQAKQAIDSLDQTLSQYNMTVDNLAQATRTLDKNQETTAVNLRFVNKEGKDLAVTFEKVNGVFQEVSRSNKQFNDIAKANAEAEKKATKAAQEWTKWVEKLGKEIKKANQEMSYQNTLATRYQQATDRLGQITQPFQSQIAGASPEKAIALARAMDNVRSSLVAGRITLADFDAAWNNFQRVGTSALVGLDKNVANSVFNLNRSLRTLGDVGENSGQRILLTWAGVARLFIVQQLHRFIGLISNEFTRATKASIDFSVKVAELQTISLDSGVSFQDFVGQVRQLSDAFGQNNAVVTEALYEGLSNQVIEAANSVEFMQQSLKLATATGSTANDSVNILSSAINSFNLSTADSARIAGVFFKTVELGRVRLTEMANDFGTIGPLAARLGITFEEVNAVISSLTRTGIKYNEVNTIISSIMNELLKPSKELQELFDRLGVSSGEAAIKTFGFAGFMRILNQESELGAGHLGDLFNNVRALRGIIGNTGDGINEFESDLKSLRENGIDDLSEGFNKIADTDAKKLQIEFNKLKNFFEIDLGLAFQKTLNTTIQDFGGLVQIVREAANTATFLVSTFVAYRIVMAATNLNLLSYIRGLQQQVALSQAAGVQTNLLKVSVRSLSSALFSANVIVSGLSIAIGLIISQWQNAALAAAQFESRISELNNEIDQQSQKEIEAIRKAEAARNQAISEGLVQSSQRYARYVTEVVKLSQTISDRAREQSQAAADAFKSYIDQVADGIRDAASKAADEVKKLERLKDEALNNQRDIQVEAAKNQVRRDVEVAKTPEEKAAVLQDQINKIDQALFDIQRKGINATEDELLKARQLAELKQQYAEQLFQLRLQHEQTLSKEEQKLRAAALKEQAQTLEKDIQKAENDLKRIIDAGKGKVDEKDIVANQREQRRLEEQIRQQKEAQKNLEANIKAQENIIGARQKAEQEILEATRQRLEIERKISEEADARAKEATEKAAKLAESRRSFDDQAKGFVKDSQAAGKAKFETIETDPAKIGENLAQQQAAIEKGLEDRKAALLKAASDAGLNGEQMIALQTNIENEINRIKEQLSTQRLEAEAKALQQQVINAQTLAAKQVQAAQQAADEQVAINEKAEDDIVKAYTRLAEQIKTILADTNIGDTARQQFTELLDVVTKQLALVRAGDTDNTLLQQADSLIKQYTTLSDVFNRIVESQERAKNAGFFGSGFNVDSEAITNVSTDLGNVLTQLLRINEVATENNAIAKALQEAQAQATALQKAMEAIVPAAQGAGAAMENPVKNTTNQLPELIKRYEQLVALLNAAAAVRGIPGIPRSFGGHMQFMAAGGRGIDTVPAMLAPGEYVMNREVTAKHYTQLVAMNQGRQPRNFAQGGSVTTVGDINITVNDQGSVAPNIDEISRQLKRRIRLGRF